VFEAPFNFRQRSFEISNLSAKFLNCPHQLRGIGAGFLYNTDLARASIFLLFELFQSTQHTAAFSIKRNEFFPINHYTAGLHAPFHLLQIIPQQPYVQHQILLD
jgi:hypothetical protein